MTEELLIILEINKNKTFTGSLKEFEKKFFKGATVESIEKYSKDNGYKVSFHVIPKYDESVTCKIRQMVNICTHHQCIYSSTTKHHKKCVELDYDTNRGSFLCSAGRKCLKECKYTYGYTT